MSNHDDIPPALCALLTAFVGNGGELTARQMDQALHMFDDTDATAARAELERNLQMTWKNNGRARVYSCPLAVKLFSRKPRPLPLQRKRI